MFLTFVIGRFHTFRQGRCLLRLVLCETTITVAMLHIVRIVAFGTDKPAFGPGAGPLANPFAMNTLPPVAINLAVTLAAELLWLVETDRFVAVVHQLVALSRMMAIQAPDVAASMR